MSDGPEILLAHHLKALKLPTFLREHQKLARQCAAEGMDHVRYLARVSTAVQNPATRRRKTRPGGSGLRHGARAYQ